MKIASGLYYFVFWIPLAILFTSLACPWTGGLGGLACPLERFRYAYHASLIVGFVGVPFVWVSWRQQKGVFLSLVCWIVSVSPALLLLLLNGMDRYRLGKWPF